jgi:tetratricopeptide (TPR) repeat protein
MSPPDIPSCAVRLRTEREARLWDIPEMARELRRLAPDLPDIETLARMIRRWEAGQHRPGMRYQLLYARAFGCSYDRLFAAAAPPDSRAEPLAVMPAGEVARFGAWAEATGVGPATLEYYATSVSRLAHEYLDRPPAPLLTSAAELARDLFDLLQTGHQRLDQRRELYATAAKLCAFMAWAAGDLGQMRAAEAHARTALVLAEQADIPAARALALCAQSKTAFWDGRRSQAATLARKGFECSPNDTMKVFLALQEADAWQELGNVSRALQAVRDAERARAAITGPDDPGGLFSCGMARQGNYTMAVHLRAADVRSAIAAAEQALQAYREGEERAYGTWAQIHIGMAHAYLISRHLEAARSHLAPVLAEAPERRLAPVVTRVLEIGQFLAQSRYRHDPLARDLREEIGHYRSAGQTTERRDT